MRIRQLQPSIVWEVSPNRGYSTFWILQALQKNAKGKLFSFDIVDKVSPNIHHFGKGTERFKLVIGDFLAQFASYAVDFPCPDYVFLDSEHSPRFGQFWTTDLFPWLMKHHELVHVSLHDVFNPWISGVREADPLDWTSTLEGQAVINWLAFNRNKWSCSFTPARSSGQSNYTKLMIAHVLATGTEQTVRGIRHLSLEQNPTIFFTLSQRKLYFQAE